MNQSDSSKKFFESEIKKLAFPNFYNFFPGIKPINTLNNTQKSIFINEHRGFSLFFFKPPPKKWDVYSLFSSLSSL